jgi:PEP-CTERM motif
VLGAPALAGAGGAFLSAPAFAAAIPLGTLNPPNAGSFHDTIGGGAFTVEATFDLTVPAVAATSTTIAVISKGNYTPGDLERYDATTSTDVETEARTFGGSAWTASFTDKLAPGDYEVLVTGTDHLQHLGVGGTVITAGIPEPSTWAMLTLGFIGLGYAAFRRNAKGQAVVL